MKRLSPLDSEWATRVRLKAGNRCGACGKHTVRGQSHHLDSYSRYPNLRHEILNGKYLCWLCHNKYHIDCGKGNNTREQFINWLWLNFKKKI